MKKLFFFTLLLLLFSPLYSGVFPKPEMDFDFVYQIESQPAILPATSEQIQCEDNQCLQSKPLGLYGIQKLYCQANECFSIAYKYSPYQKLIIDFSDGIKRESNVFPAPDRLHDSFQVTVRGNDLWVERSAQPQAFNALLRADAWLSLIIILLTEVLAAFSYLAYTGKSYRVLYSVVIANLITMPLAWQVLGQVVTETALRWLFCVAAEALIFWLCSRRQLSLRNAAALSVAVNVTSYSVGSMISFIIAPYLF